MMNSYYFALEWTVQIVFYLVYKLDAFVFNFIQGFGLA